jgi:anti-sigma factor RsiW
MRECDDQYPWLGEFLTEYVDGTMSPAARAAFDECLRGNPDLAGYVERLRLTRRVLCGYGCGVHAPCNLREQLHARLLREGLLEDEAPEAPAPSTSAAPAIRATLVLIACAMGAALFAARPSADAPAAAPQALDNSSRTPAPVFAAGPGSGFSAPISARLTLTEARVPTRADSVRRARHLAERWARIPHD